MPTDAVTFGPLAVKALDAKPDGIVFVCNAEKIAKIIKELKSRGWTKMDHMLVFSSGDAPELYTTGGKDVDGVEVYNYINPFIENARWNNFKEAFEKDHNGMAPFSLSPNYYDALYMIKEAIEKTGVTGDPKKLKEERKKIADYCANVKGFKGIQFTWDMKDGIPTNKPTYIFSIKDGQEGPEGGSALDRTLGAACFVCDRGCLAGSPFSLPGQQGILGAMKTMLPIAMSDIHAHLTQEHVEVLFGKGHSLTKWRDLTIPGAFACHETVEVRGPAGSIRGAVVVGPTRKYTQVEVSFTNAATLGITPPLRESGDLEGSAGALLVGTAGQLALEKGVVAALRHIHMNTQEAREYGVSDGQRVKIRVPGERGLVFENVVVRVDPEWKLEMHIDYDEGRAAGVVDFQLVELIR